VQRAAVELSSREQVLRTRIQAWLWLFIAGLVLSGATAIPLQPEVNWLVRVTGADAQAAGGNASTAPAWAFWLVKVQHGLDQTAAQHPFLFYGTDWAFGHFMIALAFVGALRDPVRNSWLFTFGMMACVLVAPYAFVCGALRGIPLWWRLIDCSFGVFGLVPLWLCDRWAREVEAVRNQ
jgi:hypothetical protein